MSRKNRKSVAAAPAADVLAAAVAAAADAPPVAMPEPTVIVAAEPTPEPTVAPTAEPTAEPTVAAPTADASAVSDAPAAPKPRRMPVGRPHRALPLDVHPTMTLASCLVNGTPKPHRNDSPVIGAATFTADDLPALLDTAARLLVSCGATVPGFTRGDIPADAADPLVADYLSNRATDTAPDVNARNYFERNRVSALDRIMYPTRAAERIVYVAERFAPFNKTRHAFSGCYRSMSETVDRRDSVALAVATMRATLAATPAAVNA